MVHRGGSTTTAAIGVVGRNGHRHGGGGGGGLHVVPLDRPVGLVDPGGRAVPRKSSTERTHTHTADENAPPSSTTAATTPTSPKGARGRRGEGGGGGASTTAGGGGTGAARRRQIAGDRAPPPSPFPVAVDRHALRIHRRDGVGVGVGGGGGGGGGGGCDGAAKKSPLSSRRLRDKIGGNANASALSPRARLQKGVFLAKTAGRRSAAGVSPGCSSTSAWGRSNAAEAAAVVVGAGPGGSGPSVGSPQEAALVLQRKEGRVRNPGPAVKGVPDCSSSRSSNGSPLVALALRAERGGPTLVSPHICIGSGEDARNLEHLKELGVTHVLNCARQLTSAHPKEFVHARLELEDAVDQDLHAFRKPSLDFLRHVEGCGGRALVHCIAGCSRSVSIVLLHLMESHGVRLKAAYEHVRRHRMVAQPNEGFRFQLATLEVKLFRSSSVSRDGDSAWNFYRWNEIKQNVPHHDPNPPRACGCTVG